MRVYPMCIRGSAEFFQLWKFAVAISLASSTFCVSFYLWCSEYQRPGFSQRFGLDRALIRATCWQFCGLKVCVVPLWPKDHFCQIIFRYDGKLVVVVSMHISAASAIAESNLVMMTDLLPFTKKMARSVVRFNSPRNWFNNQYIYVCMYALIL